MGGLEFLLFLIILVIIGRVFFSVVAIGFKIAFWVVLGIIGLAIVVALFL